MNIYRTASILVVLTLGLSLAKTFEQLADSIQPSNLTAVEVYLRHYGYLSQSGGPASLEEITDALKKFQDFVQINVTGKTDETTLKVMAMPRCGVSDNILSQNYKNVKWNTTRLTYKFINYTPRLPRRDIRTTVSDAFNFWAAASKLTFTENRGSAYIEIMFRAKEHGDGYTFDGQYGVLAHAFFPNPAPLGGDTHFDDDEQWSINGAKGVDLLYVATHEFGHALGLPHSKNGRSVMKPFYSGYDANLKLDAEDVREIQKRYGAH